MHAAPTVSQLRRLVAQALDEDLGRGDLTTESCIDPSLRSRAVVVAREPLVFCGGPVIAEVYRQLDAAVTVEPLVDEGCRAGAASEVLQLAGPAAALLMGERVALNFAQHMSAIATFTRRHVDQLPAGCTARITDTRKTTPGLRVLERYAVRCGGGHNHREDLGAAVLIKDNHIAAAGGIAEAIRRAKARSPHTSRVTCEVDTLEQLRLALDAGADVVMLDNFSAPALAEGVALAKGRALVEVSGGVTVERIAAMAEGGADIISVGALTHSAGSVDLGLDWRDNL